jgi:DNA polymerase-1
MARMFLVDGSNYAFRVHFALPPRHSSDGFPTRVLYGFTQLLHKLMTTWQADYVAVCFDKGATFRNERFPDYKGHRPEMPEDLRQQWPHLSELCEAMGFTAITLDGFEADDVIGTLAKRHASPELEVFIVSSDKDLCQLVGDDVTILNDQKGETVDHAGVVDRWGVPPEKVVDVLGLCGDASDNIPGVTKVGEKTAIKLVQEHGSLEGALRAAAEGRVKGAVGQRLVEEAETARLSYWLATIALDAPVPHSLDGLKARGPDEVRARALFDAWEFGTVARKLLPERAAPTVATRGALATPEQALAELLSGARPVVAPTFDADGHLTGLAAAGRDGAAPAVWLGIDGLLQRGKIVAWLADPAAPKQGHGLKALWRALAADGLTLAGVAEDLRLLDYVLASHRRSHDLADLAARHLDHTLGMSARGLEADVAARALAVEAADVTSALLDRLVPKLTPGQAHVYREIELPLVPILARMEVAGIALDTSRLSVVDEELAVRLTAVEAECHALAGHPFHIRSRHELRDVLFTELGLPPSKKVKDGWSTDSDVLEKLVDLHALPGKVLAYRSLDKLRGTYLTKLPGFVEADGRIHTTFLQDVAATGRLASNDPNLQNIPVRSEEGRRIRGCFVPAPGHVFLSADYSQIELRVLAHFTGDPVLKQGFLAGEDIHRRTAIEVFGANPAEVSVAQRSAAKAINFGLLYGMSAFRLGNDLQIPQAEAQRYMDAYFARMPAVRGWIEDTKAAAHQHGWVETMFGRRRMIPEIHSQVFSERAAAEREAVNTVIQGTAADLIKLAMIAVDRSLAHAGLGVRMLLQVHDELLLEVPEGEVDAARALVVGAMQEAASLSVPLEVTTAVGATWEAAHG